MTVMIKWEFIGLNEHDGREPAQLVRAEDKDDRRARYVAGSPVIMSTVCRHYDYSLPGSRTTFLIVSTL